MLSKIKFVIKEILYPACFYFAIFNTFAYILDYLNGNEESNRLTSFAVIIGYFTLIAIGNRIFKTELNIFVKHLIHYLVIAVPPMIYYFILNGDSDAFDPSKIVIAMFIILIIYTIIALPFIIVNSIRAKKKADNIDYKSQFDSI